jgi:pimeloyl-ACP methyl ester carboxylesterase
MSVVRSVNSRTHTRDRPPRPRRDRGRASGRGIAPAAWMRARVIAFLLASGCSDDAAPIDGGGSLDAGSPDAGSLDAGAIDAGAPPAPLVFEPCTLTFGPLSSLEAECARPTVPLDWMRPEGRAIDLWVMRYGAHEMPRAQIWFLQGGPGASGYDYGPLIERLAGFERSIEFFTLDHRGVGESARLGCAVEESDESEGGAAITDAEWPGCLAAVRAEWADDLDAFSSEGAARDLAWLIERTRREGVPVVLYGASYGTTLAQRFLQIFPDVADGVAIDSINWPDRTYDDYDLLWDEAGRGVFDACAADAICREKLGSDPRARLEMLYDRLEAGHCAELELSRDVLRAMVAWAIAYAETRPFAPALVYRIDRCSSADVEAVGRFYESLFGPSGALGGSDARFSTVLSQHIINSEIAIRTVTSDAELDRIAGECVVCLGVGSSAIARARSWPRYPFDDRYLEWPATERPVLAMVGELDPFAPARRLEDAGIAAVYSEPGYVRFNGAPHGSIGYARDRVGTGRTCGEALVLAFALDPAASLDTSCGAALPDPYFTTLYTRTFFGTADLWE